MTRSGSEVAGLAGNGLDPILLCDWNGTLVSDANRAWSATCTVLRAHGQAEIELEQFRESFRLPLAAFFSDLGLDGDTRDAIQQWNDCLGKTAPQPSSGADEMLDYVASSGIVIGVISAARSDIVRADIAAVGFGPCISFVLGGIESKPEMLTALVISSARPVAYLGDTEHDMRAANIAGATAIGYAGGYRPASALQSAGAHTVVDELLEVGHLMLGDSVGHPTLHPPGTRRNEV
jgi:phosphoglycolate phosphatase-like HAD superfamily hydrolase